MNREQILASLKSSILTIRDKGKELATNEDMYKAWVKENNIIREEVNKLDSCDMLWLNDEYGKWFREEIQPIVEKLSDTLKQHTDWV